MQAICDRIEGFFFLETFANVINSFLRVFKVCPALSGYRLQHFGYPFFRKLNTRVAQAIN